MARPAKQTVDYFPHIIKNGKTITILENKFGNDGYAFWFKLLEILGSTEGHFYEYTNTTDKEFLHARTLVSEETAKEILDLLADLNAIDPELWQENIIWSDNFVDNIEDAYSRRKVNVPQKPTTKEVNDNINESEEGLSEVSDNTNPQSKVNESKVNETNTVCEWPADLKKEGNQYQYPDKFEKLWQEYPDRDRDNKFAAYKQVRNRIVKDNDDFEDLLKSAKNFRQYQEAKDNIGTNFIPMARTYFGAGQRDYLEFIDYDDNQFSDTVKVTDSVVC